MEVNNNCECPRCHNIFPVTNKIMHDAHCTEENPMPLDASRINGLNQEENKEEIKEERNIPIKEEKNIPIKKPPSGEFPDVFECDICHQIFMEKERDDHMFCHNLEKEEKNRQNNYEPSQEEIARQREIEKQIERDKRKRQHNIERNNNRNNYRNNNMNNPMFPNDFSNDINMENPNDNLGVGNFLNNLRNVISQQSSSSNNSNYSNYSNYNYNNNNPNGGFSNSNSNVTFRFETIGPNGQRNVRIFQNNGNDGQNQFQSPIFFSSSNNRRRRQIPFMSINDGIFENIFEEFLQRMGSREHPTDEEILNELPETQIEDVNKLDQEKKNCIICLEDFKNGDKAIILPCIHLFHTECIKNWLKTQNTCPICKFKLTGENINAGNGNMGE